MKRIGNHIESNHYNIEDGYINAEEVKTEIHRIIFQYEAKFNKVASESFKASVIERVNQRAINDKSFRETNETKSNNINIR